MEEEEEEEEEEEKEERWNTSGEEDIRYVSVYYNNGERVVVTDHSPACRVQGTTVQKRLALTSNKQPIVRPACSQGLAVDNSPNGSMK